MSIFYKLSSLNLPIFDDLHIWDLSSELLYTIKKNNLSGNTTDMKD